MMKVSVWHTLSKIGMDACHYLHHFIVSIHKISRVGLYLCQNNGKDYYFRFLWVYIYIYDKYDTVTARSQPKTFIHAT